MKGCTRSSAAQHPSGELVVILIERIIANCSCQQNAVSPGFLRTDLFETATAGGATDIVESEAWTGYEARQGRKAQTDEIGDVVVLLSTPRMSLVNAHNLVIDG